MTTFEKSSNLRLTLGKELNKVIYVILGSNYSSKVCEGFISV